MINNRKGQALSKTGILFVVIVFYAVTITFIGYINAYYNSTITPEQVTPQGLPRTTNSCDCGTLTCSEYELIYGQTAKEELCAGQAQSESRLSFIGMVISGISDLPVWINFILFGSLVIIVGWLIITSLPLWNGGS
jgi:hypothetical protein